MPDFYLFEGNYFFPRLKTVSSFVLNSGHVLEPCGQTYCSSLDHPGGQGLELNIAEACPETESVSSCV